MVKFETYTKGENLLKLLVMQYIFLIVILKEDKIKPLHHQLMQMSRNQIHETVQLTSPVIYGVYTHYISIWKENILKNRY
jgi:hypothetical protein